MSYAFKLKIALFACLLFLVNVGGGLGQSKVEKTPPSSEQSPTTSNNIIPADSDSAGVVRMAYKNLLTSRSYRLRTIWTFPRTYPFRMLTTEQEYVAPDRLRTVNVETESEIIVILDVTYYRRDPKSEWEKSTNRSSSINGKEDHALSRISPEYKSEEIKIVGPETLNGMPMMVYQEVFNSEANRDEEPRKFWIGVRDNLLYKVEIGYYFLSNSRGGLPDVKKTLYFYDYNADIEIEPPI